MTRLPRIDRSQGLADGGWKHIDVRLNRAGTFEILENYFLNPMGPRMAKGDDFPDWPTVGIATQAEALELGAKWDEWCEQQVTRKGTKPARGSDDHEQAAVPQQEVKIHFEQEKTPPPISAAKKSEVKTKPKTLSVKPPATPPAGPPLGLF